MSELGIASSSEPLSLGDRVLDRYVVAERLAVGGHSIVYRGVDERLSRPVCIKVFHKIGEREGVWRTAYEHFVQEAFALSKLTHPNTLRIYDFGFLGVDGAEVPDEGREAHPPFQVSEYMNAGTLSQVVRLEGPVDREQTIEVITALCGALAEAHERGIVHRDIKPKNILFGKVGRSRTVKLADFGIAKSRPVTDDGLQYRAGDTNIIAGKPLMMLSPSWAAPEQITGGTIGPATDTYSLALIAIFMLTGRVVFSARTGEEAYHQRNNSAQLLEKVFDGAGLPPAAVEVLTRACSFDFDERPREIDELGRELAAALRAAGKRRAPTHLTPVPPEPPSAAPPASTPPPSSEPSSASAAVSAPAVVPAGVGPPRHLRVADGDTHVGDRRGIFVPAPEGVADVVGARGRVRVRLTLLPGRGDICLHVKALNCFVAHAGQRPSPAVQVYEDGAVDFVLPNQQLIASARIGFGKPAAGHTVFAVGGQAIALPLEDCPRAISVDFGSGAECLLVYVPPASVDGASGGRSGWRRRRGTGRNP